MQRWLSKVRPFFSTQIVRPSSYHLLHSCAAHHHHHHHLFPVSSFLANKSIFNHLPKPPHHLGFHQSLTPPHLSLFQSRHVSSSKERRLKRLTPAVSKLKKYKIKPYSSFKFRFRTLKGGQIRRWHAGTRHNAHLKSKISKRRLRRPAVVHPAYAKVMKKLNFYG